MTIITDLNPLPVKPSAIPSDLVSWIPAAPEFAARVGSFGSVSRLDGATPQNPDGSARGFNFIVPGKIAHNSYAAMLTHLHGRTIGVRYRRQSTQMPPVFDLMIDGVSYRCNDTLNYSAGSPQVINPTSTYSTAFIVRNLEDRLHEVILMVPDAGVDGTDYSLPVYGFLVEKASGYAEAPRTAMTSTPTAVPTTAGSIVNTTQTGAFIFRGARKLIYYNSGASPAVVTISRGGVAMAVKSIAAGDTYDFDFGVPIAFDGVTPFQHLASATGVFCTTIGVL